LKETDAAERAWSDFSVLTKGSSTVESVASAYLARVFQQPVSVLIAAIALPALTLLGELWFMPVLFGTLFLWSFAPALRSD